MSSCFPCTVILDHFPATSLMYNQGNTLLVVVPMCTVFFLVSDTRLDVCFMYFSIGLAAHVQHTYLCGVVQSLTCHLHNSYDCTHVGFRQNTTITYFRWYTVIPLPPTHTLPPPHPTRSHQTANSPFCVSVQYELYKDTSFIWTLLWVPAIKCV